MKIINNLEMISNKHEVDSPFCIDLYNCLINKVLNKPLANDLTNICLHGVKHISYIYYTNDSLIKNFDKNNKNLILKNKYRNLNHLLKKINNKINKFDNNNNNINNKNSSKCYIYGSDINNNITIITIVYFELRWGCLHEISKISFLNKKKEKITLKSAQFIDHYNIKLTEKYMLCEINYKSSCTSLILVKPSKNNNINDIEIDNNILSLFTKNRNAISLYINVPIIKKSSNVDLNNILENSKFQNINYKSEITIDGSSNGRTRPGIYKRIHFDFDKPFKYYIYNKHLNIILFSGIFDG